MLPWIVLGTIVIVIAIGGYLLISAPFIEDDEESTEWI
jgi:hypothetical protein